MIRTEILYRFPNGIKKEGNSLVWDTEALLSEILAGLCVCKEKGKIPESIGIDTWGVDYVLLDRENKPLLPVHSYRDPRTKGLADRYAIPFEELYRESGLQKLDFNTVYQLSCDRESGKLDRAAHFLMIPDYLRYLLTGRMQNEVTDASTTALLDARTRDWSDKLLSLAGIPRSLFCPFPEKGETPARLLPEIAEKVGFQTEVLPVPGHDTACAVLSCPLEEKSAFLSAGTWSLLGKELAEPILTEKACKENFTNEGGVERSVRFLKNITGTWLISQLRKEWNSRKTWDELMEMALSSSYRKTFDAAHPSLLAPESMEGAVLALLGEKSLPRNDLISACYHSLAGTYAEAIAGMERITGEKTEKLFVVGGGSRDRFLLQLFREKTGLCVVRAEAEGTALGNIAAQRMLRENLKLKEIREILRRSFPVEVIE